MNKHNYKNNTLYLLLTALFILTFCLPVFAQKAIVPGKIVDAGGEFEIDSFTTTMNVRPYAESVDAQIRVKVIGLKGSVTRMMFIMNGGRRVYNVTYNGQKQYFTHVGDFLTVDLTNNPLMPQEKRDFIVRYTGKVHSVSSKLIRTFKIEKYVIQLVVIPRTGDMTAKTNLEIVGYKDKYFPLIKLSKMPTPPPLPSDPSLGLALNNNYVIDRVLINNKEATYTHAKGYITIDVAQNIKPNEKRTISMAYVGKIRNSDRNRIWDNFDNAPFEISPIGAY